MAKITALLHTFNDERRIGRALDSLRSCDELLVIDHDSDDRTKHVAQQHGARVRKGVLGVDYGVYAADADHDWILCLLPCEALNELLEAALLDWKQEHKDPPDRDLAVADAAAFAFAIREETGGGWKTLPQETRLVNRKQVNWPGKLPPNQPNAQVLPGEILRFKQP